MTEPSVLVGRVGKPHGLDGSFHVLDPVPSALEVGAEVLLDGSPVEVVGRKGTDVAPILRLSVAADRAAIEALRGQALTVARSAVPALDEDEYWAEDIVGCLVVAGDSELGTVERMVAYPSCEVLFVGVHLIPLVKDAIAEIDLDARRITVNADFLGL